MSDAIYLPRLNAFLRPGEPVQAEQLLQWSDALARTLETWIFEQIQPTNQYTVTNLTPTHALDAAAAPLATVRSVLGTVITDLQTRGDFA